VSEVRDSVAPAQLILWRHDAVVHRDAAVLDGGPVVLWRLGPKLAHKHLTGEVLEATAQQAT